MSVDAEMSSETRSVLGPGGNRVVTVLQPEKKNKQASILNTQETRKMVSSTKKLPEPVTRNNGSVNNTSSCSSDSSSSVSSVKIKSFKRRVKRHHHGLKSGKVAPDGEEQLLERPIVIKRCDWITPNSDRLYTIFHDEEWGIPVHDDNKLFELLVLSTALAELSWPDILNQRDIFRKLLDNFDPASVAKFNDKNIQLLKANGNPLLSEPKLRAVVENAKQMLKVQQEFGSFSNYCWSFVNHKPIKKGYRYVRHVPVKTPKAEAISKDLMRRGFRCVGPTVVYSFMQAAGIVNDHLITCFRYQECISNVKKDTEAMTQETELAVTLKKTCLSTV
ncbi:hypothetical protein IFM89_039448 [Coptis chinensis]|uniref:DNA-3-methyladenine glycosylase I n=1 Tax=Coptis chinensis TaxID=261450 RepID=A0A835LYP3_9MAGN|nr:hypothetical protein IFM89_039448 [Coptis chinensis]